MAGNKRPDKARQTRQDKTRRHRTRLGETKLDKTKIKTMTMTIINTKTKTTTKEPEGLSGEILACSTSWCFLEEKKRLLKTNSEFMAVAHGAPTPTTPRNCSMDRRPSKWGRRVMPWREHLILFCACFVRYKSWELTRVEKTNDWFVPTSLALRKFKRGRVVCLVLSSLEDRTDWGRQHTAAMWIRTCDISWVYDPSAVLVRILDTRENNIASRTDVLTPVFPTPPFPSSSTTCPAVYNKVRDLLRTSRMKDSRQRRGWCICLPALKPSGR